MKTILFCFHSKHTWTELFLHSNSAPLNIENPSGPRHSPVGGSAYYDKLQHSLSSFLPISLQEMDRVMLFDRFDQKFLLPESFLPSLLEKLSPDYFALEVKGTRIHTYHTRYFDTAGFDHYLAHHNLRKSRFKFRHRIYVESDLHFFEIKEKNNKDRTVKSRVLVKDKIPLPGSQAQQLISETTPVDGRLLEPKLWSNFHRITLVHKEKQERMTIDINVLLENDARMEELPGVVILELKQEKKSFASPIVRLLIGNGNRPGAMSKYTMGVNLLYPQNKSNLFLPTRRILHRLKNAS